ncbi:hypothetical protein TgHK011_004296 [Trichoderma gracile]|nr:hypothetical protein TgHK011_004296 [Trichoderma gracile]
MLSPQRRHSVLVVRAQSRRGPLQSIEPSLALPLALFSLLFSFPCASDACVRCLLRRASTPGRGHDTLARHCLNARSYHSCSGRRRRHVGNDPIGVRSKIRTRRRK